MAAALAASMLIGACSGGDDTADEWTPPEISDETAALLRQYNAGRFRPASSPFPDDVDAVVVPTLPSARVDELLSGQHTTLTCARWDLGRDGETPTVSCTEWSYQVVRAATIRCTFCPQELSTGIDPPNQAVFRAIDLSDPDGLWRRADTAERLRAVHDSVVRRQTVPPALREQLTALYAKRPTALSADQRATARAIRAILAVF